MKEAYIALLSLIVLTSLASAACPLNVTLVNQDPEPAVPGDYVKLVFQMTGISEAECGEIKFKINEAYPFSLDPGVENEKTIQGGLYYPGYGDYLLAAYDIRVDKTAIDKKSELEVSYSYESRYGADLTKKFNISVEDPTTNFEIHVKSYSPETKEIVFEILNSGEKNAKAFTAEIPEQQGVYLIGAGKVIVGDIDSNDQQTATFDADVSAKKILLNIQYTDQVGTRRSLEQFVDFDLTQFSRTTQSKSSFSPTLAFILGIAVPIVWIYARRYIKKRKEKNKKRI